MITCGYKSQKPDRMLPISKVDGGDNPADLMTKNVGIALAMKHMTAVGIRSADGRSEAVVKMHHIETKDSWNVGLDGTYLNVMKNHEVPRTSLYLPGGEEEYPVHSSDLEAVRIASGVTASGKVFEIEDNWRRPGRAERELAESRTGSITFAVKASARSKVKADLTAVPDVHRPRPMPQPRTDLKGRP